MIFRQLFDKESSTYTYLVGDEATREAALVDPVLSQLERDCKILDELGLKLMYVLETHVHADHITSSARLREMTGCKGVVPAAANVGCADRFMQDSESLQIGAITITALATPGHTDSHVAYRISDDRVLTGDALFIRGCGRTDFQNGNAGQLYDSVTQRLFTLPDDTLVYPGHDYRGLTVTTIGEEKRCNPRFLGRTREQFSEFMAKLNLPMPQKLMEALPANELCGRAVAAAQAPSIASPPPSPARTITARELKADLGGRAALLVDVSEPEQFAQAHIDGALSMPISTFDAKLLPRSTRIVVCCQAGLRSHEIAANLVRDGFDAYCLEDGVEGWKEAGFAARGGAEHALISIERQVQIVAGVLIVLGVLMALLISPWFFLLSGVVGAGLVFAGITGNCMVARALARLPYNQLPATRLSQRLD